MNNNDNTFGPAYDDETDGERIKTQMETIRDLMLDYQWRTVPEIKQVTGYMSTSISAQLRHLRKKRFGGFTVDRRRRKIDGGTYEFRVTSPIEPGKQASIF